MFLLSKIIFLYTCLVAIAGESEVLPFKLFVQWTLGNTAESCTQTCTKIGGKCDPASLKETTTLQAFETMVNSSIYVETCKPVIDLTYGFPVSNSSTFCHQINDNDNYSEFAPYAVAFFINLEEGYTYSVQCFYSTNNVTLSDCSTRSATIQRFCPCSTTNETSTCNIVSN
jgi:hypothetical protein